MGVVLGADEVFELGKGTERSRGLLEQRFDAAAERSVVGCMVLDELINQFIESAEIGHLGVVLLVC